MGGRLATRNAFSLAALDRLVCRSRRDTMFFMTDIVVLALFLAFAGLCLWLTVKVFLATLPYLIIAAVGYYMWKYRLQIKIWWLGLFQNR